MPKKGMAGFNCVLRIGGLVSGRAQDVTLNCDATEIDTTTRDSGGWKEFIQGLKSWSLDKQALWVPDNVAITALRNAYLNGSRVSISFEDKDGVKFTGYVIVTAMGNPQPLDGALTCTFTLRGDGALTYTGVGS